MGHSDWAFIPGFRIRHVKKFNEIKYVTAETLSKTLPIIGFRNYRENYNNTGKRKTTFINLADPKSCDISFYTKLLIFYLLTDP